MRACKINGEFRGEKCMINKKGQEEMVGFVIIVVIISVVLLVSLGFMLKSNKSAAVENYEVENFIQASLQHTSSCETYVEYLSIQDLIVSCQKKEACMDGTNSCDILNESLINIIKNAWNIEEGSAVKGYKLKIIVEEEEILLLKEGNETRDYKGAFQDFAKGSNDYEISLNIYY